MLKKMNTHFQRENKWFCYLILGIFLYIFLAKAIAIFHYHYIMDEFVDLSIGADLYRGLLPFRDIKFNRPFLFNYFLSLPFYFMNNSLWILWVNRFWFFLINMGILLLVYKITKYYLKKTSQAFFSILLVGTTIPFLFNGSRLRCDVTISFLYLLVFYFLLIHWKQPKWCFLEGSILGFAFLISQKAVYYILLYFFSLLLIMLFEKEKKVWLKQIAMGLLGLISILGSFIFWVWIKGLFFRFYQDNILRAFHTGIRSNVYNTFHYLLRFVYQNIFTFFLLFFSLWCYLRKGKDILEDKPNLLLGVHALGLIGITLFHKARFPYFFLISIPLLAVFTSIQIKPLIKKSTIFPLLLVGLVAVYPLFFSCMLWKNSAGYQYELIQACETYLHPEDSYFDGIGMVFSRKKASQLNMTQRCINEYYQNKYPRLIPEWIQNQCKLFILNYRIKNLKNPEKLFISNNYLQTPENSHILLPGKILKSNETEFEIFIEGSYKILNNQENKIIIDQKEVSDSIYLSKGKHSYSLDDKHDHAILIDVSVDRYKKKPKHWRSKVYLLYSW